ncbi:MAG: hypothetical protein UR98_C0032G0002 [Parcubacteria group bacterium GW2011_GWA1_36_12]|nr:MAG: hypothetical protein UR98_C0032G0002 [Parcubacteria group bacterium GW2011_GWA1_36_12]
MKASDCILVLASNRKHVQQAIKISLTSHAVIMALNLDTEYYLRSRVENYDNSIYDFLDNSSTLSQFQYIRDNFDTSYNWYKDPTNHQSEQQGDNAFKENDFYRYIRDRFGYFLVEFERSLNFAQNVIVKLKPKRIYIPQPHNYKGSSVMSGTLKPAALFILAKSQKIQISIFENDSINSPLRMRVGQLLRQVRSLNKQVTREECELLILANPRHLIAMNLLITILSNNFKTKILTYNVTTDTKRKLDSLYGDYLEKERFFGVDLMVKLRRVKNNTKNYKHWNKLTINKYINQPLAFKFIKDKLKRIIDEEADEIIKDYLLANKVMSQLKPKILITTTDPDSKILPYVDKANQLGISTINIQHGAFFSVDPPTNVPESQYFITWSRLTKLALTGNKYFKKVKMFEWQSPFHSIPHQSNYLVKRRDFRVLILTAIYIVDVNIRDYYYKALFESLSKVRSKIEIVVRTKSFQDPISLSALSADNRLNVRLDDNLDLHESIRWADIVIFENTTAGLDAMLLGKPAVYFNPYWGNDFFGLAKYKAAVTILNKNDLNKIVNFLNNRSIWPEYSRRGNKFAKEYFGLNVNDKSKEIVNILKKVIIN